MYVRFQKKFTKFFRNNRLFLCEFQFAFAGWLLTNLPQKYGFQYIFELNFLNYSILRYLRGNYFFMGL